MPSRSAATRIGGCSGTVMPSRKPLTANVSYSSVTFSPVSAARRNRIVSRTRWYGLSNGMPFHRSTITSDDVPMPSAKRPGRGLAHRSRPSTRACARRGCTRARSRCRSRSAGAHCAASDERRERVVAARLGRPQVGVAEVDELLHDLALLEQRDAVERERDAVSLRDGHRVHSFHVRSCWSVAPCRTIVDWLAVPSSVPSSAHRCTRPWPKPSATACTRMSASTHSVGYAVRDAQRVVEAVAAGALAERLADPERHEVADDRERGGRHLEQLGQAHPERALPGARRCRRARRRAAPSASRASSRLLIVPSWWCMQRPRRARRPAAGTSGRIAHWPSQVERASTERAEHGEDLVVADVRDHARLADLVAAHDLDRVELERPTAARRTRGTARSPRRTAAR